MQDHGTYTCDKAKETSRARSHSNLLAADKEAQKGVLVLQSPEVIPKYSTRQKGYAIAFFGMSPLGIKI
jgi:hypothetical protein